MKSIANQIDVALRKIEAALFTRGGRDDEKSDAQGDALRELQDALLTALDEFQDAWED